LLWDERFVQHYRLGAALYRAESLWNAAQVIQVFPNPAATSEFIIWMNRHQLGRKRLLDTMLATT
jgi:hypothetical protein